MTQQTLPATLDFGLNQGLTGYLQAISDAPILSQEEERELARLYREQEDLEAARRLVFSHLRYVVSIERILSTEQKQSVLGKIVIYFKPEVNLCGDDLIIFTQYR